MAKIAIKMHCFKCEYEEILKGKNHDGKRCPKCNGGPFVPIGICADRRSYSERW